MDVEASSLQVAKHKRVVSEQEEMTSDLQSQLQLTTDILSTRNTKERRVQWSPVEQETEAALF